MFGKRRPCTGLEGRYSRQCSISLSVLGLHVKNVVLQLSVSEERTRQCLSCGVPDRDGQGRAMQCSPACLSLVSRCCYSHQFDLKTKGCSATCERCADIRQCESWPAPGDVLLFYSTHRHAQAQGANRSSCVVVLHCQATLSHIAHRATSAPALLTGIKPHPFRRAAAGWPPHG